MGCKSKSGDQSESAAANQARYAAVVRVDGTEVARVARAAYQARQSLAAIPGLPPPNKWKLVTATAGGGKQLFVSDLTRTYPGHSIRFYLGPKDAPAIGVFRDPDAGGKQPPAHLAGVAASPAVYLVGVARVEISTQVRQAESLPNAYFALRVAGAAPVPITTAMLSDLPRVSPPDGEQTKGWRLNVALAPHLGDKAPALRIVGADGTVDLPAGTLADESQFLFVKVNRRGELRFRWWSMGPTAKLVGEVRGLSAIDVVE